MLMMVLEKHMRKYFRLAFLFCTAAVDFYYWVGSPTCNVSSELVSKQLHNLHYDAKTELTRVALAATSNVTALSSKQSQQAHYLQMHNV